MRIPEIDAVAGESAGAMSVGKKTAVFVDPVLYTRRYVRRLCSQLTPVDSTATPNAGA